MHHFCTLFDGNYAVKGVVTLRSLKDQCPDAVVFVLCMDDLAHGILKSLNLPDVVLLTLGEVEDEELLAVKPTRSVAEYCWTLSPCLPWHILSTHPEVDSITYIDADMYFFNPLTPLLDEIGDASITIIEHRFPPALQHLEINGRFCVEWVGFRRDVQGLNCLARWREQCIEWCFHRLEETRMGDQKYLDEWPSRYGNLHIITHPGAGLAPWNYSGSRIETDDQGRFTVGGQPLIFYHFHQFQLLSNGKYDRLSDAYRALGREPEHVYTHYEAEIGKALAEIRAVHSGFAAGLRPPLRVRTQRLAQVLLPTPIKNILKKVIKAV